MNRVTRILFNLSSIGFLIVIIYATYFYVLFTNEVRKSGHLFIPDHSGPGWMFWFIHLLVFLEVFAGIASVIWPSQVMKPFVLKMFRFCGVGFSLVLALYGYIRLFISYRTDLPEGFNIQTFPIYFIFPLFFASALLGLVSSVFDFIYFLKDKKT